MNFVKWTLTLVCLALMGLTSSYSVAQENTSEKVDMEKKDGKEGSFAEHKQKFIEHLNNEKTAVDQALSCANTVEKHEDLKKCRETLQAARKEMGKGRREERKEHLKKKLKELEDADANQSKKK